MGKKGPSTRSRLRPATPLCGRPVASAKGGATGVSVYLLFSVFLLGTGPLGFDQANLWAGKTIRARTKALERRGWRDERVKGVSSFGRGPSWATSSTA